MTRKERELIEYLKNMQEGYIEGEGYDRYPLPEWYALNNAINALEQQPCGDCISREKAKQFLYERIDRLNDDELYDIFSRVIDDMYNELPSVTPQPKEMTREDKYLSGCLYAISKLLDEGSSAFATKVDGKWEIITWAEICEWIDTQMEGE